MPYRITILLFLLGFGIISYLIGSLSFAIIITKLFTGHDIRKSGSGNAGMTNVMRMVGFWPGLITFLCDFGKSAFAVCLGKFLLPYLFGLLAPSFPITSTAQIFEYSKAVLPIYGANICGFFAVLGHLYPLYFKFKGGKGISSIAGAILVIDWRTLVILFSVFMIVVLISKIISLASVTVAILYPLVTWFCFRFLPVSDEVTLAAMTAYRPFAMPVSVFLVISAALYSALTIIKHRENIVRLFKGTEKKLKISNVRIKK